METNILYSSDHIEVMHECILDDSVDLVYIDSPILQQQGLISKS
jgi:hypothetical protein